MEISSHHWKRTASIALAVASTTAVASAQLLQSNGKIVAYSGGPVPGLPGVTFDAGQFSIPVIDDGGFVLFRARMSGSGVTAFNNRALFRGTSAADLTLVIRGQDPAPGLPGLTLNTATGSGIGDEPRMCGNGRTQWGGNLSGSGVTTANGTALFGGFAGNFVLVARQGDPAPGTVGAAFGQTFSGPSYQFSGNSSSGRVLFESTTVGGDTVATNNLAWFSGVPGALELVQRKGDTVLGGAVIGSLGLTGQINSSGQVLHDEVLSTTLGTMPASSANNATMWIYTPGSGNALVVREGDPAPGTAGATFNTPGDVWVPAVGGSTFNNNGQAAIYANLQNGDVIPGGNDAAIYIGGTSGLTLALRRGAPAPGTLSLFDLQNSPSMCLNNAGALAFSSTLTNATPATDSGVFAGAPGSLTLVAREGDLAPGTVGAMFDELFGHQILFNDRGQVLFSVHLIGGDTTPTNQSAVYGWDPVLGLTLVVRSGDSIQVAPSDTRVVGSVGNVQFSNGDGEALSFNHNGTFTVDLNFTNSTTAIVSAQIPGGSPGTDVCTPGVDGIMACPCGNAQAPAGSARGCDNSGATGGAKLTSTGVASLTSGLDTLHFTSSGQRASASGTLSILLQGASPLSSTGVQYGQGVRCIGVNLKRLYMHNAAPGSTTITMPQGADLDVHSQSAAKGDLIPGSAGSTRSYMMYYRDPNVLGACSANLTWNDSNTQSVVWGL
jgi:hypothetical protein